MSKPGNEAVKARQLTWSCCLGRSAVAFEHPPSQRTNITCSALMRLHALLLRSGRHSMPPSQQQGEGGWAQDHCGDDHLRGPHQGTQLQRMNWDCGQAHSKRVSACPVSACSVHAQGPTVDAARMASSPQAWCPHTIWAVLLGSHGQHSQEPNQYPPSLTMPPSWPCPCPMHTAPQPKGRQRAPQVLHV